MVTTVGQWLLVIVPMAILLLLVADRVRRWRINAAVRGFQHQFPGKDLLLVYTDSPHWAPYIEDKWLPRWGARAVALNRSRPWSPDRPEVALWRALIRQYDEHTPLAVVLPRHGPPKVVRLFKAFRDHKHGRGQRLKAAERELEDALEASNHHTT